MIECFNIFLHHLCNIDKPIEDRKEQDEVSSSLLVYFQASKEKGSLGPEVTFTMNWYDFEFPKLQSIME